MPKDLKEREVWLSVIPRDNIRDHKATMICEKHWPADYPNIMYQKHIDVRNIPMLETYGWCCLMLMQ